MRFSQFQFELNKDPNRVEYLLPFLEGLNDANGNEIISRETLSRMNSVTTDHVCRHVFTVKIMARPSAGLVARLTDAMIDNLEVLFRMVGASQRTTEQYITFKWKTEMTPEELTIFWESIQRQLAKDPVITNVFYDTKSHKGFIVAKSCYVTEFDTVGPRDGCLFAFDPDDGFVCDNDDAMENHLNEAFSKTKSKSSFVLPHTI